MSQPPCATYSGGHEWVLAAVHNLNADFKFQCWKGTNLFHFFQVLFLATFLYERSSLWTCRIIHPWPSAWVQHYSMLHPQWLLHSLDITDNRYCRFCSWHWLMLLTLLPYKCIHKAVSPPHCQDSSPTSSRRILSLSESVCSSALSNRKHVLQVNITKSHSS